jgi:hypothetical protein
MRTRTAFYSFSKLALVEEAPIVARVAMVCNDLAIANDAMGHYKNLPDNALSHIRQGGALYFTRISCGHLREGVRAIQDIRTNTRLTAQVEKCDSAAQTAFAALCECIAGGKDYADFRRYVMSIRDKASFHYDGTNIETALVHRNRHHWNSICAMTIGETVHSCRFDFADVILDTIVCRDLWAIPMSADARFEADRIADWCFTKSVQFLDFGGEFVARFLQQHC